jgi:hypothetical protein
VYSVWERSDLSVYSVVKTAAGSGGLVFEACEVGFAWWFC